MARFDRVAGVVQRLAVLTSAGIPPVSAWGHIAASELADERVARVSAGLESAHDLPARIASAARDGPAEDSSAWAVLAAIWTLAAESGAALGPALDRSAEVLRSLAQAAREVEVALAGPAATSRVVLALPVVGVLLGMLLGFDVVAALVSVPGAVCVLLGSGLVVAAVRWNGRLLRWAREMDATPGLVFDLLAVALAGGASIDRALASVERACADAGIAWRRDEVTPVLDFAVAAGVPVVALLHAESDERRRAARAAAAERAARLESRMLLPLGLCVLPAFVLLGVMPIALAILSSTALQL